MPDFLAQPAFAGLLPAARAAGAGVFAVEESLALATVQARKAAGPALRERVRSLHGFDLPEEPRVAAGERVSFVGAAPGAWLALASAGGQDLAAALAADLVGLASVTDQSDAYAVLRLSGPHVRDALAKGFTIDLHPAVFGPGAAAVTSVAHIGAILWRMPSDGTADPAFHVAVSRSYAGSFWHWLSASAAEYGLAAG